MYLIVVDETEAFNNSELAKIGLGGDPKNRFFDKSFQSICTKNARFTSNVDVRKQNKTKNIFIHDPYSLKYLFSIHRSMAWYQVLLSAVQ